MKFLQFAQIFDIAGCLPLAFAARRSVQLLAKTVYRAGLLGHIQSKAKVFAAMISQNIARIVHTQNTCTIIKMNKISDDESDVMIESHEEDEDAHGTYRCSGICANKHAVVCLSKRPDHILTNSISLQFLSFFSSSLLLAAPNRHVASRPTGIRPCLPTYARKLIGTQVVLFVMMALFAKVPVRIASRYVWAPPSFIACKQCVTCLLASTSDDFRRPPRDSGPLSHTDSFD